MMGLGTFLIAVIIVLLCLWFQVSFEGIAISLLLILILEQEGCSR
jgi:hypothetical protein